MTPFPMPCVAIVLASMPDVLSGVYLVSLMHECITSKFHIKLVNIHTIKQTSMTMQIDVEGCELEVLQGIQPHHWSQISQVSNQDFAMLTIFCTGHAPNEQCSYVISKS